MSLKYPPGVEMRLVYAESENRLFCAPGAPDRLKERAISLREKLEAQKKTGKKVPSSYKASFDFTQ